MTDTPSPPPFRVGQSFDIHAHTDDPDRVLVLGGVAFDGATGLAGHSDADVVAHVCADALLGVAPTAPLTLSLPALPGLPLSIYAQAIAFQPGTLTFGAPELLLLRPN